MNTRDIPTPDVRLYHRAVVVAQDVQGQLRGLVRQLSIDQFENESRRVSMGAGASEATSVRNKTPLFERTFSEPVGAAAGPRSPLGAGRPAVAAAAPSRLPLCCCECWAAAAAPVTSWAHPQHCRTTHPPLGRASTRQCCASSSTRGTGRPPPTASLRSTTTRSASCATRRSASSSQSPACSSCAVRCGQGARQMGDGGARRLHSCPARHPSPAHPATALRSPHQDFWRPARPVWGPDAPV